MIRIILFGNLQYKIKRYQLSLGYSTVTPNTDAERRIISTNCKNKSKLLIKISSIQSLVTNLIIQSPNAYL